MFFLSPVTIIFLTLLLHSCDSNVRFSKRPSNFVASVHIKKISEQNDIPQSVKNILAKEKSYDHIQFPLPYFLVPEEHADYIRAHNFDVRIADQLTLMISGAKYHKMFIHPDTEAHYDHLKNAYRYFGPDETEFVATALVSEKCLVVWNKIYLNRRPFMVNFDVEKEKIQSIGLVLTLKNEIRSKVVPVQTVRSIASVPEK